MRRLLSWILCLALVLSLSVPVMAAGPEIVFTSDSSFQAGGTVTVDKNRTLESVYNYGSSDAYNAYLEGDVQYYWMRNDSYYADGPSLTIREEDRCCTFYCLAALYADEDHIQQIGTPTDIYNEPQNAFVADFIGESNILNGKMVKDKLVEFVGHEFECVDEGFGENVDVDVVVRPEDIYIMNKLEGAQLTAKVKSCTFKGVHYEMFVETDKGYELMIQDYNAFEPDSEVGLIIRPADIQVMHKERTCNTFEGEIVDETHVKFLGETFECLPQEGLAAGDKVKVEVAFSKIDLIDHPEEGMLSGDVYFLLYKGDHYHLTIMTDDGDHIWVDTNDIWDKGDLVGINIAPQDIKIVK